MSHSLSSSDESISHGSNAVAVTSAATSPRRQGGAVNAAYVSDQFTNSNRAVLKEQLADRQMFNVPVCKHYLEYDKVDEEWLESCYEALCQNTDVRNAVRTLRYVTDAFVNDNKRDEKLMYQPLVGRLVQAMSDRGSFADRHPQCLCRKRS